jgi:hypothetical protein
VFSESWFISDSFQICRPRERCPSRDDATQAYRDSLAIGKKLAAGDPRNTQRQRDLYVSYWRMAGLAETQKHPRDARTYWKQAFDVLLGIDKRGLHLSPEDRQLLETLRRKVGASGQ